MAARTVDAMTRRRNAQAGYDRGGVDQTKWPKGGNLTDKNAKVVPVADVAVVRACVGLRYSSRAHCCLPSSVFGGRRVGGREEWTRVEEMEEGEVCQGQARSRKGSV